MDYSSLSLLTPTTDDFTSCLSCPTPYCPPHKPHLPYCSRLMQWQCRCKSRGAFVMGMGIDRTMSWASLRILTTTTDDLTSPTSLDIIDSYNNDFTS